MTFLATKVCVQLGLRAGALVFRTHIVPASSRCDLRSIEKTK